MWLAFIPLTPLLLVHGLCACLFSLLAGELHGEQECVIHPSWGLTEKPPGLGASLHLEGQEWAFESGHGLSTCLSHREPAPAVGLVNMMSSELTSLLSWTQACASLGIISLSLGPPRASLSLPHFLCLQLLENWRWGIPCLEAHGSLTLGLASISVLLTARPACLQNTCYL